jgi:NitT/TauT family transport system substrate-binding protein
MRAMFGRNLFASCVAGMMTLGAGSVAAKDLTEILMGTSVVSMNSSMFTAAMDLGYFEAEGLNMKFMELQGGTVVMLQVATKSLPVGAGALDPLVANNQPGKTPMPIKFFYNQTRDYIWEMLVPPNSPIKTIADLKGKKVGVGALTNSHIPVTRLIMKDAGLKDGEDYSFTAIGVGGPAFKALLDGQVDAYFTWVSNTAGFETQPSAVKLRRLAFSERYKTLISQGFFAHVDTIKNNPELLIGFGRAVAKATVFCEIAMKHCIKSYWKARPNLTPREGTVDENAQRLVPAMQEAWKTFMAFPPNVPRRFGEFPKENMENLVAVMAEGGEVAAKYDPSNLYTNELVARINDFDVAAIEKQAQAFK